MKKSIFFGVYSMFFSVLLGAFGAHGLKPLVSEYGVEIFNKGVYYQVIHSLGILIGAVLLKNSKSLKLFTYLVALGILGFSGSLYVLAFSEYLPTILKQVVGPITPMGGVFFAISWVYLAKSYRKEMNI